MVKLIDILGFFIAALIICMAAAFIMTLYTPFVIFQYLLNLRRLKQKEGDQWTT